MKRCPLGRTTADTMLRSLQADYTRFSQRRVSCLIFREQISMISALHVEHVRNGGTHTLSEFLGTGEEPPGWEPLCKLSFFQYDRLIESYQREFGVENVLALPLELLRSNPDDFHNRIFDFAGIERKIVPNSKKINVTWAASSTELCRILNRFIRRNPLGPKQPVSYRVAQKIIRRVERVHTRVARHAHGGTTKEPHRRSHYEDIVDSNLALAVNWSSYL